MSKPESVNPGNPDPEATVRLTKGEPPDAYSTQRLNIEEHLAASDTLKLRRHTPEADATQRLERLPPGGEPPLRVAPGGKLAQAEGHTHTPPVVPPDPAIMGWKLPLALGALVVLGAAIYLVFSRGPATPSPGQPVSQPAVAKGELPPAVQGYLDQAKAGDAHAMRMLGVMYTYGLDVPQDREKGLYWYRQAAEKGSDAARAELQRLEGK